MEKTTRKSNLKQVAVTALSNVVLVAASASSSTACMVLFYQPKTPQSIQTRLAKPSVK